MSPSKRKPHSRTHSRSAGSLRPNEQADSWRETILKWSIGVLIVARMLIPTEAAVQGNSLWMVQLWLGLGVLWTWNCRVNGDRRIRFDWIDSTLWLLIVGHIISALYVVVTAGGDQRAALNMMWEWVGLGISFFLVRQIIRTRSDGRNLLVGIVSTTVVLAGLGLWQHYVSIPQTAEIVDKQMLELTRLENASALGLSSESIRIQELRRDLQSIPLEEPARSLFLKRLRTSTEPFGFFALANSFAGLLIPGLMLAIGLILSNRRTNSARTLFVMAVLIVFPIVYCLLLTKSRTAWVGLIAGLFTWGLLRLLRGETPTLRRFGVWTLSTFMIFASLLAVAGLSGGIDREVISESPKSLKYRLQYWTGAWKVIQDRPLLGTGPGNFRQHYLQHKAPESSEEIADPHNLVLDVWTSGGIVGVIGLLGLCLVGMRKLLKTNPFESGTSHHPLRMSNPLIIGVASSFLVVYSIGWLAGGGPDHRLAVLFPCWVILAAVLAGRVKSVCFPSECLVAASVGLLVHLLGAGGIEMPAITQILIVLFALGTIGISSGVQKTSNDERSLLVVQKQRGRMTVVLACGGTCGVLFGLCFVTSSLPVLERKSLLALGDRAWFEGGNPEKAMTLYRDAAEADPFSPEPLERLAALSFQRWEGLLPDSEDGWKQVDDLSELVIELDPYNFRHYRDMGLRYLKSFSRTGDSANVDRAVQYLSQATVQYPNNSRLRAELADAMKKSGRLTQARQEAEEALRLDTINQNEMHTDKFLPPAVRAALQELMNSGRNPQSFPKSEHNRN